MQSDPSDISPADVSVHERDVDVGGSRIHYLEAGPSSGAALLLLHGGRFDSSTWKKLGSIQLLASRGYRVLALDLPGYGDSPKSALSREDFLPALLKFLDLDQVVILSPSMSGGFSLPMVASHPAQVRAYVPVAPAGVGRYGPRIVDSPVPTLILWGSADRVFPVSGAADLATHFQDAEIHVFEGASHPCYLDQPEAFHQVFLTFLEGLRR